MIYKKIFYLEGTTRQQQIIAEGLDKIKFPFERLKPRRERGYFRIGWRNLNSSETHPNALKHAGPHPKEGDPPAKIEGEIEGRKYTLGIFYPWSGDMFVDLYLEKYPEVAQTTVSAEVAHLVDYFLPLTDLQRDAIGLAMHKGQYEGQKPTWWETSNYASEYYFLIGESFMQAYTLAYSDMEFNAMSFKWKITKDQAPEIRRILGIQRTDYVPPVVPAPEPVKKPEPAPVVDVVPEKPAEPKPEPIVQPEEPQEPEQPKTEYKHIRGSRVYHQKDHRTKKSGDIITDTTGLRPCKVCKP